MTGTERPYRSHLQPACAPCRQRKSRCTINTGATTCLSCQVHGTVCSFTATGRQADPASNIAHANRPRTSKKRRTNPERNGSGLASPCVPVNGGRPTQVQDQQKRMSPRYSPDLITEVAADAGLDSHLSEGDDGIAHVVGPITAFDNDILEKYLSSITATATPNGNLTAPLSQQIEPASTRVMFDTIRKRPLGARDQQSLAASKCEMIEQLIGLPINELLDVHFRLVNQNFPLFDEESFRKLYQNSKTRISPALLCNLYASALPYWTQSPELSMQRCPERSYVWFLAAEALYSEMFLAPGMSVIIAMILNVNGRPSTSMLGNGGLNGFATSLAFSLGLNRNPKGWNIAQSEKHLRIRIWWQVVLFDKWFSFGYGTPSRIQWSQFDVPYPTLEELDIPNLTSMPDQPAANIYLAFLTLTRVLDRYLDFVYCLDPTPQAMQPSTAHDLHLALTQWEESLDGDIRDIIIHKDNLDLPGAANFRLAYLGIRLFLCKIQLDLDMKANHSDSGPEQGLISQLYLQGQRAAEDIVQFVKHLDDDQLKGFWSPVCGFTLTSATTFLLRSSLRSTQPGRNRPLTMVKEMMVVLRKYCVKSDWDLPEHCIKKWAHIVDNISSDSESAADTSHHLQEDFSMDQWMMDELFSDTWGIWAG